MNEHQQQPPPRPQRPPATFRKAILQHNNNGRRPGPNGYLAAAPTCTEVVGSEEYDRLIAAGWHVVESWQVWRCVTCGGYDSDRQSADLVGMAHVERYGHESVRPDELQRSGR
ncbi:hypothetical protein [Serinicoccus sediminis]|uniref:hypothetical protein n=1 Tax=Serinicoccus sediminis TaxID=2306021 RepID=UPI001022490E|nr:hypothetical protein [Serinicoccus sediminis]